MIPITRSEMFLAAAAGDADAPSVLPPPVTREDYYVKEVCERLDDLADTSAAEITAAVTDYLDENGIGIRVANDEEFEEAFGFECE
ncbi:MAG: hypothetical protein IIZ68_07985 [Clostridia bacterium]|nr:hypothetical protein [Clostridia bacterium]